jgi:hypothetical protein
MIHRNSRRHLLVKILGELYLRLWNKIVGYMPAAMCLCLAFLLEEVSKPLVDSYETNGSLLSAVIQHRALLPSLFMLATVLLYFRFVPKRVFGNW